MLVRKIQQTDNAAMAQIIRSVMTDFGAVGPGYSIEDPEVDAMFEAYDEPRCVYYVISEGETVLGGAGIAPLDGGSDSVCELKKMYFLEEARGRGLGKLLCETLCVDARRLGFRQVYIETLDRMQAANRLYAKLGFRRLEQTMGNTGHCRCDAYYALDLAEPDDIVIG